MSEDSKLEKRKRLVQLIRQIAREEAYAALDEHLSDYEHRQKPPEEVDRND
jgi:DNA-binding FadR family transcriptional regulator